MPLSSSCHSLSLFSTRRISTSSLAGLPGSASVGSGSLAPVTLAVVSRGRSSKGYSFLIVGVKKHWEQRPLALVPDLFLQCKHLITLVLLSDWVALWTIGSFGWVGYAPR